MKKEPTLAVCVLCQRNEPLTKHHLIPANLHKNKWFKKRFTKVELQEVIMVCRPCHNAIHRFIPNNKVLAREYDSLDKLLTHEGLIRFVEWRQSH